jgi:hypothetical protein
MDSQTLETPPGRRRADLLKLARSVETAFPRKSFPFLRGSGLVFSQFDFVRRAFRHASESRHPERIGTGSSEASWITGLALLARNDGLVVFVFPSSFVGLHLNLFEHDIS